MKCLLILTLLWLTFFNDSIGQYIIGKPYEEPYVVMQYCCAPCLPKSKTEMDLGLLPTSVMDNLTEYWTSEYDSLFLMRLTFKHVQMISCIWPDDSLTQKVRYEIAYCYSDSVRGIASYNIRILFDSLGNIYPTKYPYLVKLNEANFPKNKNSKLKISLLDKSRIDSVVLRNNLSGGRLFYNALYEYDSLDQDTMIWEFIKKKGKKRYRVYVDAFSGEIVRKELILPPPPRY